MRPTDRDMAKAGDVLIESKSLATTNARERTNK